MSSLVVTNAERREVEDWMERLHPVPTDLIRQAYAADTEDFETYITQLIGLQWVCQSCGPIASQNDRLVRLRRRLGRDRSTDSALVDRMRCPDCQQYTLATEAGTQYGDAFPAWGTMWMLADHPLGSWASHHLDWFEDHHLLVYDSNFGWLLGVDGAGFNFYTKFWIPLYRAVHSSTTVISGDR